MAVVAQDREKLVGNAELLAFNLRERLGNVTETLYTLRSFYRASNYVSDIEFHGFAEQDFKHTPEVEAVFFIPVDEKNVTEFRARSLNGLALPDHKTLYGLTSFAATERTQDEAVLLPAGRNRIVAMVYEDKIKDSNGAPLRGYYLALLDQTGILANIRKQAANAGLDIALNAPDAPAPARAGYFTYTTSFGLGGMPWRLDFSSRKAVFWHDIEDFTAPALILLLTFLATLYVNALLSQREQRARTFQTLREAHDAAKRANAAKNQFLANMSHEIRTPLNGIMGMANVLLTSELKEDQRNWVHTITNSGQGLLGIVNDILDFFDLDSEMLRLESKPFDLESTVSETIGAVTHRAAIDNGVDLLVEMRADMPCRLIGDAARTAQIITNLLGNALKFTRKGHVLLAIDVAAGPADSNRAVLTLRVEDTGIGIPSEKQAHVFEKFTQGEDGSTRRFGGTGLGLSITRGLVNLMNGTITLESAPGIGSIFTCKLPVLLETQANASIARQHRNVLEGLHALILDTSPAAATALGANLESLGINCLVANSPVGITAPYDFVLYSETTGKIAPDMLPALLALSTPQSAQRAPLVIRTISSGVDAATDEAAIVPQGIAAIMPKSLTGHEWGMALTRLCHDPAAAARSPLTADDLSRLRIDRGVTERPFENMPVLVVDDMNLNRLIMTKILRVQGCDVDQAANGLEALDATRRKKYRYIFMDCHMPEMDGYKATRLIREEHQPGTPAPVIIAVTADVIAGNRDRCLAAGMNDYLAKPVTPDRVAQVMRDWLAPESHAAA